MNNEWLRCFLSEFYSRNYLCFNTKQLSPPPFLFFSHPLSDGKTASLLMTNNSPCGDEAGVVGNYQEASAHNVTKPGHGKLAQLRKDRASQCSGHLKVSHQHISTEANSLVRPLMINEC